MMGEILKDIYLKNLGKRIAALRIARGWNQDNLGDKIGGVERQSISRLENGHHDPGSFTLVLIAEAFGMSLKELLDFDYKNHIN